MNSIAYVACTASNKHMISHGDSYSTSLPSHGAFQKFATVPGHAVAELPTSISLIRGAVLPLSISTAAAGLYQKHSLAVPFPTNEKIRTGIGRTLLVWGGSSSVGSSVIQLAVASGVEVYATASARNFGYCKQLGAEKVFDYHDGDVEEQVVDALKGKTVAGAYHAVGGDGAVLACARIVDRCVGKAIVVTVRGAPETGVPGGVRVKASEWCFLHFRTLLIRGVVMILTMLTHYHCSIIKLDLRGGQPSWSVHLA
jgi:NADPH:quinone reductase-like Zn-dependent oxidoreductase